MALSAHGRLHPHAQEAFRRFDQGRRVLLFDANSKRLAMFAGPGPASPDADRLAGKTQGGLGESLAVGEGELLDLYVVRVGDFEAQAV